MTLAVGLVGLCILLLGAVGVVQPHRVLDLVARLQSRGGLYFIAGLRVLIGAALLLAAPDSRLPLYLQVLGIVSLISGVVTPLFGVERFAALLRWWRARSLLLLRVWCAVVVAFGASLVWAVFPALRSA